MSDDDHAEVAVIGGGVVGCAVAHALARRGVPAIVLEARQGLALEASGSNSGILHTGFDSQPGALETRLILRSAQLRERLLSELGVQVLRCGARLRPREEGEREAVARLAENARANGVATELGADGSLGVPGESVTDPAAFVQALAAAARSGGACIRLGARVDGISAGSGATIEIAVAGADRLRVRAAVNCAGLRADEIAGLAGERPVGIYPRKGEFLVFAPPEPLREILLPVPSALGKGVLVFPTLDGRAIAGPTAREREDKDDWSVEPDASRLIRERAERICPALASAETIAAYAGLRPAGLDGANYVIEPSRTLPGLVHVAAIRSTGLSASLGIGEHVAQLVAEHAKVELGTERSLPVLAAPSACALSWWERAARRSEARR